MRTLQVSTDPDEHTVRTVTLPSSWDDGAARALAQITPTTGGPVRLATEAARWIDTIDAAPPLPGTPAEAPPPGRSLSCLLLMRQLAPNTALWQRQPDSALGFVLRLSSFVQDGIFAAEHYVACVRLACDSLRRLHAQNGPERSGELPLFGAEDVSSDQPAGLLLLTDLDPCLAALGFDYDSDDGRRAAQSLTALASLTARAGTDRPLPACPDGPLPGIRALASSIVTATGESSLPVIETGFSSPGPVDGLLGAESCGLAPVFSPLDEDGKLRDSTLHRLAHRGLTPEAALAQSLGGSPPPLLAGPQAHQRMHEALAAYVDHLPPLPEPETEELLTKLERGVRRALPSRQTGFAQRSSIGGHRLFLQTSEFEDGTLGAVALTPPRESPMARGLMECLSQAVSIGLQFGAPLEAFVEQFAYTRFGPCGTVEGDPAATYATSMLDYAFRALSDAYLGQPMPDAPAHHAEDETQMPMLPFEAADEPTRGANRGKRRLRLVS